MPNSQHHRRSGMRRLTAMQLSIIVPTFNEAPNVVELVRRVTAAVGRHRRRGDLRRRQHRRHSRRDPRGRGIRCSSRAPDPPRQRAPAASAARSRRASRPRRADTCLVIDGDLQHPPEEIPALYERFLRGDVDVVVASRYAGGGTADGPRRPHAGDGLEDRDAVTRAMFPIRLRDVSDPMTGFFLVDRRVVDSATLKPRGLQDPPRDPRPPEPARRGGAVRLRRPARRRVEGVDAAGHALPHAAHRAPLRQDVAVRRDRRARRGRERADRVGADPRGRRLHRRGDHRGRGDDHRQLPPDRAVRLPRHARPGIRRAGRDSRSRSDSTTPRRSSASRSSR